MTFEQLLREVRQLKLEEVRVEQKAQLEVVVKLSELPVLTGTLTRYFGDPYKPQGQESSDEAGLLAAPFGGIFNDQTMYLRREKDHTDLALIWPWGSGVAATVKIIHQS